MLLVSFGCKASDTTMPADAVSEAGGATIEGRDSPNERAQVASREVRTLRLEDDLTPPKLLSAKEVGEDVANLELALQHAWGGHGVVPPEVVSQAESALDRIGSQPTSSTPDELCKAIAKVLATIPDAHFAVGFEGRSTCPGERRRRPSVGKNIAPRADGIWSSETREHEGLTIEIIGINRFEDPSSPRWAGLLDRFADRRPDAFILDLRGNGGGADTYAYWIAQALGGKPVRRSGVRIERSQHPIALTMTMNLVTLRLRADARRTGAVSNHLDDTLAMLSKLRDEVSVGAEPSKIVFEPKPSKDLERPFPAHEGPVALLVDAGCGSSCENAVYLIRQLPNVTVVGENTAGAIHFGQGGRLVLPNSNAIVTIATQAVFYEDGGFWEKSGFAPDVHVEPGHDALERAVEVVAAKVRKQQVELPGRNGHAG